MIEELLKYDTNFNEATFKSYVDNIFVKLYTSIMIDNLDSIKHFISDNVYNRFKEKITELNNKNIREMYDELNVKSTEITNIQITDKEYIITVSLKSRYLNYIVNKETGKYIEGNNTNRIEKNNILTLTKIREYKDQPNIRKCPTCGNSLDINKEGKCPYCGNIYPEEQYNYILTNIQTY